MAWNAGIVQSGYGPAVHRDSVTVTYAAGLHSQPHLLAPGPRQLARLKLKPTAALGDYHCTHVAHSRLRAEWIEMSGRGLPVRH
jgi:hypothetical protein